MSGCQWEAVGVRGRRQGSGGDKTVGLKILLKTCGLGDLLFSSFPVLKGTDRERLGLTHGNGDQIMG